MARICETTIVLILSLALSTYSALAKRVSISGTHSFSDIYGSCSAAGG
jgi:hypothetical protein